MFKHDIEPSHCELLTIPSGQYTERPPNTIHGDSTMDEWQERDDEDIASSQVNK